MEASRYQGKITSPAKLFAKTFYFRRVGKVFLILDGDRDEEVVVSSAGFRSK